MQYPIRINKYLRDQGFASRREADDLIAAGKVFVNGKRALQGMLVQSGDAVELRGANEKEYQYLAYYKPQGLATQSQEGSESVIAEWREKGLFPIGRLDKESEGLLILTNDGRLTTKLLSTDSGFEKEYLEKVGEHIRKGIPAILKKGMNTKTFGRLLPANAKIIDDRMISIALREGKRHQIRVMLAELGYSVKMLKRVRIGPIKLGKLRPEEARPLSSQEIKLLF